MTKHGEMSFPSSHRKRVIEAEMTTKKEEKIEWCKLGYTEEQSKEKCPLGGCWKYRCFNSTLNAQWHEDREKWREKRYGKGES